MATNMPSVHAADGTYRPDREQRRVLAAQLETPLTWMRRV
jgi:hypothetical protein